MNHPLPATRLARLAVGCIGRYDLADWLFATCNHDYFASLNPRYKLRKMRLRLMNCYDFGRG